MSESTFHYDYPIKCIVAEFDILGFKNIISKPKKNLNIKQIADSYEMYFTRNILYSKENLKFKPKFQIFSDTALTYQKYEEDNGAKVRDYKEQLFDFFKHLCIVMVNSIFAFTDSNFFANRISEFPIRGGISSGAMIIKHIENCTPILMGKPIIDAYEWEQAQNWLGLSINPNSISNITNLLNGFSNFEDTTESVEEDYWQKLLDNNILVEYNVPTKIGPIKTFVVNFVPKHKQDILAKELKKSLDKYKNKQDIYAKYYATQNFVDYIIENKKEINSDLLVNGFSNI